MKITFKGDYALKALLDLSIYDDAPQTIEEISKRQDIPAKFLEQIMLTLKKGGFVKAIRGKNGGYTLSRDASKITMGELVRYIEGPVEPIGCVQKNGAGTCGYSSRCALRDVFAEIGKYTAERLEAVTFADLRDKQIKKEAKHAEYYI
jgi:Rrf2 family transcriptional regulator, cysteine metabolism repressor